jgi:hypothetical protein
VTHAACYRLHCAFEFASRIEPLQFLDCVVQVLPLQFVSILKQQQQQQERENEEFVLRTLAQNNAEGCVCGVKYYME